MRQRAWFERHPERLTEIREVLSSKYPTLKLTETPEEIRIDGAFPIAGPDEQELGRFQLQIRFPRAYPDFMPEVLEVGGRIPRVEDRHVFPKSGAACLMVPEEWTLDWSHRGFAEFMAGPVYNYFLGQLCVEEGMSWPLGERSHGLAGLYESYGEMVGFEDRMAICKALQMASSGRIKGHRACPCSSGRRIRDCHPASLARMNTIGKAVARSAALRIIDHEMRKERAGQAAAR